MNNQTVKFTWKLLAERPRQSGDYLTCAREADNSLGYPTICFFSSKEGWEWETYPNSWAEEEIPEYWAEVIYPVD